MGCPASSSRDIIGDGCTQAGVRGREEGAHGKKDTRNEDTRGTTPPHARTMQDPSGSTLKAGVLVSHSPEVGIVEAVSGAYGVKGRLEWGLANGAGLNSGFTQLVISSTTRSALCSANHMHKLQIHRL